MNHRVNMPDASVIICTHNPVPATVAATFAGLQEQTYPRDKWEFLVIDNASERTAADLHEQAARAGARLIIETKIGLTPARLRGIQESRAPLLIFVDDDNILRPNYLEQALVIAREWPRIGTWGGSLVPRWQSTPPSWTERYWNWIAVRAVHSDRWSNGPQDYAAFPYGAGMCVRRDVAEQYATQVRENELRAKLDRSGNRLFGGGDADLSFTALALGYGNGVFQSLELEHLIPDERLKEDYLLRLVEDMTCSHHLLNYSRQGVRPPSQSRSQRLLSRYEHLFISPRDRRFVNARLRGIASANKMIHQIESESRVDRSNGNGNPRSGSADSLLSPRDTPRI